MKILNGLKVKEKKYSGVLMVLILSFLLHLIPIFIVKTPTSGPDEVISLASAAKLAGYDWSYLVTKFGTKYGCGSAWYLAPLFYFITNGKIIYNLARTVLAFILALQSVVCWLILKKIFEYDNELEIAVVSLAGSFFSNATADIFCNEAILTLSTWLFIYFILKIYKYGSNLKYSLILIGVFSYCCICHARTLIYLPSILVVVFFLSLKKKKSFLDYRAIIIGSAFLLIAWKINRYVGMQLYRNEQALNELASAAIGQSGNAGLVKNFILTIKTFGIRDTLKGILTVSATNAYAILIFTGFGFAASIVCFFFFLKKRKRKNTEEMANVVSMFCMIGLGVSILAMGVINCWHGINLMQGDVYNDGRFFFYLRYYINFLPPMVISLYVYMKEDDTKKLLTKAILLALILYLLFRGVFLRTFDINGIEEFDVGKLFEAFSMGKVISYSLAFKISLLISIILIMVCKKSNSIYIYFTLIVSMLFYQQLYQCIFFRGNISETTQEYTDKFVAYSENETLRTYLDNFGKIYVHSNKVYKLEYYIQLIIPEIQVKRYEENYEDDNEVKIVFSNEDLTTFLDKKLYCVKLDTNEYLYTDTYKVYKDINMIIAQIEEG